MRLVQKLLSKIEKQHPKFANVVQYAIQVLIIASLVSFAFETLPDLSPQDRQYLRYFEVITVGIFSFEYLIRVLAARRPQDYIFSFFGIIDFISIAPFYLHLGLDLRSFRSLRLLRLFRLLKLARYNEAIGRFHKALTSIWEDLVLFGLTAFILLYLASIGIYYFEHTAQPEAFSSVFSSMWWAAITFTTVGYGDIVPITTGGRILTCFLLMLGLGIIAVPTGLFASALSKCRIDEEKE